MHIRKEFYRYVLPSMLAFALSGVYAIADGFFVGNALGDDALAAINVAFPLTAFLQAVGTGIGMGGAVEYAISMGSGDKDRCNRFFGVSLIALFVSGLALTLVFWLFAPQVLSLFGASPEVIREVGRILPLFLVGYLFASVSRVITAYFYATHKNKLAYALIYGEPVFLFLLLLCLPALLGILGTWASVPLSQLLAMLLGLYLLVRSGGQPYRV